MAFPVVETSTTGHSTVPNTVHEMAMPSGVQVGDLLIAVVSLKNDPGSNIALWTPIETANGGTIGCHGWKKIADSADASASTIDVDFSAEENGAWRVFRITGWSGVLADVEGADNISSVGGSNDPDPVSLTSTGGAADILWVAAAAWHGDIAHSSYPTNYGGNQSTDRFADADGVGIATASRNLNASSENPGAFGLAASTDWACLTISVRPPEQLTKELSDPIALGETVLKVATIFKALEDPIVIGDVIDRVAVYYRSLVDPIALGEVVYPQGQFFRALTDAIAIGDSSSVSTALTKSVADAISLGEAHATVSSFLKTLADAIVLGDSSTTATGMAKTLSDALTIGDTVTRQAAFAKALSDAISLGDSSTASTGLSKSVADAISLGEAHAKTLAFVKALADAISLGDSVAASSGLLQSLTDAIALGETRATVGTFVRALSDAIAIGETHAAGAVFVKNLSDAIALGDASQGTLGAGKNLTDAIAIGETVTRSASFVKNLTDAIAIGDSSTSGGTLSKSIVDAIAMAEGLATTALLYKELIDPLNLGETVTRTGSFIKNLTDAIVLRDTRCINGSIDIGVSPGVVTVDDSTGFVIGQKISVEDPGGVFYTYTITAINGNDLTVTPAPTQSLPNVYVCPVSGRGWFGPQSDCGCGCGPCECHDAIEHFNDDELVLSDGAVAATWPYVWNQHNECRGWPAESIPSYEFPGFPGGSVPILVSGGEDGGCVFFVKNEVRPPNHGRYTSWYAKSTHPYIPCYQDQTIAYWADIFGELGPPTLIGGVGYYCDYQGNPQRILSIQAAYTISEMLENEFTASVYVFSMQIRKPPQWTETSTFEDLSVWQHVAGNTTYQIGIRRGRTRGSPIIFLRGFSTDSSVASIDLSNAPAFYDPHLLLFRGKVELT